MEYNLQECRKTMIWKRFWRGILATDEKQKQDEGKNSLPGAYSRLLELEDLVRSVGKRRYRAGLFPPTKEIAQARRIARELEGVDVYYRGKYSSAQIEDDTYWGRMYIKPFPFVCVVVYDCSQKSVEIHDHNILEFVEQNIKDSSVVNGRHIREALRCLNNEFVHFDCTLEDDGSEWHCSHGFLRVKTHSNDVFCHGFEVEIEFVDGSNGSVTNHHVKIGNKYLGITKEFDSNPKILQLLNDKANLYIIEEKWPKWQEKKRMMREDMEQERKDGEYDLSYAFWLLVYNNHRVPRENLQHLLEKIERNPELHTILERRRQDVDSLYSRLAFFDAHPAIAYWYSFWDDVISKNDGIKMIKKNKTLFNLTNPDCIAYHPVSMERLKMNLEMLGLRKKNGKGLFNDKILGKLEAKLEEAGFEHYSGKLHYVLPTSEDTIFDPRCSSTIIIPENVTFLASAVMLAWNGKE